MPECRNLLHESDHRKEDSKCPHEGMVIDIYGYCRQDIVYKHPLVNIAPYSDMFTPMREETGPGGSPSEITCTVWETHGKFLQFTGRSILGFD